MKKTVRQVVNAPVGNPRHAGTDEGDRPAGERKGERGPRTLPPARGSRRDRVSVCSSVSPLLSFSSSLPRPRFILVQRLAAFRFHLRLLRPFDIPRFPRLSFGVSFFFLSLSFLFPSLSTGRSSSRRRRRRRRPAGFTPANRFNLTYVSLDASAQF